VSDLSTEPLVEVHRFRGRDYTFTELDITAYDTCVAKATRKDADGTENVDQSAFVRELVRASAGLTPEEYAHLGARLARQMGLIATRMHWAEEPDELKSTDEGNDSGNA
jgi:hypothetical protein